MQLINSCGDSNAARNITSCHFESKVKDSLELLSEHASRVGYQTLSQEMFVALYTLIVLVWYPIIAPFIRSPKPGADRLAGS